jgi:hypothetical protein
VQAWWGPLIVRALHQGTLPHLAAELAETVDELYLALAIIYAELPPEDAIPPEDNERRELAQVLGRAIRKPDQFAWGQQLHDAFRERLRTLFGGEVIPPSWPEKAPPSRRPPPPKPQG